MQPNNEAMTVVTTIARRSRPPTSPSQPSDVATAAIPREASQTRREMRSVVRTASQRAIGAPTPIVAVASKAKTAVDFSISNQFMAFR